MYRREQSLLHQKSYDFALRVVDMMRYLREVKSETVLGRQVMRSGTAIGALVRETEFAQSTPDFINKLNVALKEANETDYWLNILKDSHYIDDNAYTSMEADCKELIAILVASIKTLKSKINKGTTR